MLAIKRVGADYKSCDFVRVTLGLNGPPLDPSVALDYSIDNTVTAADLGIYCYANYSGNAWPQDMWPARIGPADIGEDFRAVELSFDVGDILGTSKFPAYVEVRISSATVTREMASPLNPGGPTPGPDFSPYEVL
jgi:hypothetical protein